MILTFLTSRVGLALMAVAAMLIAINVAFFLGKREQKLVDEKTAAEQSIIMDRQRGNIDDRFKNSDDRDLCRSLGGVPNDRGECL